MDLRKTAIISLYSINLSVFETEAQSVYCALWTGSSFEKYNFVLKGLMPPNSRHTLDGFLPGGSNFEENKNILRHLCINTPNTFLTPAYVTPFTNSHLNLLSLIFGLIPFGLAYLLKRIALYTVCSMLCMTANARMFKSISDTLAVVCSCLVYLLLSSGCRSVSYPQVHINKRAVKCL